MTSTKKKNQLQDAATAGDKDIPLFPCDPPPYDAIVQVIEDRTWTNASYGGGSRHVFDHEARTLAEVPDYEGEAEYYECEAYLEQLATQQIDKICQARQNPQVARRASSDNTSTTVKRRSSMEDLKSTVLRRICDGLHSDLSRSNLLSADNDSIKDPVVVDELLARLDRSELGAAEAHEHEAYQTDTQHRETCLELSFDKSLLPNEFSDMDPRGILFLEADAAELESQLEWCPRNLSQDTEINELINTVHDAIPALLQTLTSTDNNPAVREAISQLTILLKLAKELDLASELTHNTVEHMCVMLENTEASIAGSITERQKALHSNTLEAVESLDENIADEVAELRSDVQAQLEHVEASFALLEGVEANAATLGSEVRREMNQSFQLPWAAVDSEIEECTGSRAASHEDYKDQIGAHRDQLKCMKAEHLSSLEADQETLRSDQQSIERALKALSNQYEANTVQQNVVATKIGETEHSIQLVDQDWEAAVQSIVAPADRLASRLSDLQAHKTFMSQLKELHASVLRQTADITTARECFLKSSRTRIVHKQFAALSVAYCHQFKSVSKARKGLSKREAKMKDMEEQREDAELEDDIQEMLQLADKIRELNGKFQEATARIEKRQHELESSDEVLQSVMRAAIESAGRHELLSCPVFYSTEESPLQLNLAGKAIVHPRVALLIEELETETIIRDKRQKKQMEELKRKEQETKELKEQLQRAKDLSIMASA